MNGRKLMASPSPWSGNVEFLLTEIRDGKRFYGSGFDMTEIAPGAVIPNTFTLEYEAAQVLMDELWNCGLRPSEGAGSAGSLRATENHLKDLQTLSRRLLDMVERGNNGADNRS